MFQCKVTSDKQPSYVSVVTKSCSASTNLLPVKLTTPVGGYRRRFTVCLMPLNLNYSRAYEMVEWIELNRLIGADRFTIYNYSSAPNIARVMEHYSKLDIVEVVPWNIPVKVDTWPVQTTPEIHYFGQLATLQDCLFRNMQESEFVVNIDVDEFIVPRGDNITTWSQLVDTFPKSHGAFLFRNTFFRKEWADTAASYEGKSEAIKYRLVTLLKTQHETQIMPHGSRSKYIARTSETSRLNVHTAGAKHVMNVRPEVALVHHYRNWLKYDAKEKMVPDDIIVKKYSSQLIKNVVDTWKMLPNVSLDLETT